MRKQSNNYGKRGGNKSSLKRKRFKKSYIQTWVQQLFGNLPNQDIPLGDLAPLPNTFKDEGKQKQVNKWYNIWRKKRYKRFLRRISFFAHVVYGVNHTKFCESVTKHINWYEEVYRSKGPVHTVKLFKRVRDACLRFAANNDFERINELVLHKDGLPLRVGHLMEWLTSQSENDRRAALTILELIKLVEVEGDDPSVESIVNPIAGHSEIPTGKLGTTFRVLSKDKVSKDVSKRIDDEFRATLKELFPIKGQGRRLQSLAYLSDIHLSVRKGPNGPALGTVQDDYLAVRQSGLLEPISKICNLTANSSLSLIINELELEINSNEGYAESKVDCIDSKLSIKYEPWAKTRYFAICDWFSQSALKGLHKWIFQWLSEQPEDGTMSQNRVAQLVCNWTSTLQAARAVEGVYSLDLSKATDRLPASLQREILAQIFGTEFADSWHAICTKRQFKTPSVGFVSFSVGQPLGVYSSWAMLALTHHVICRTALRLSGRRRDPLWPDYVVIGDDVAMVGHEFAKWYSLLMKDILQVDISPIKGFTPQTCLSRNSLKATDKGASAEIAKRVFIEGSEISVVSPETLLSAMEYPADFPNLLRQLTHRGTDYATKTPVAPITLAGLSFNPDLAYTFATFPLRPCVSEDTFKDVSEKYPALTEKVAWLQTRVPISVSELESMFRFSIRSGLQSTLDKFKTNYSIYTALSREPIKCGERVYHFRTREYIVRTLLNKAMAYIIELVVETNALNFQGPGAKLDEIASALNMMTDFDLALRGKPAGRRENIHRIRSRVITKLQPFVLHAVKKAEEYFGILLIDSGEQIDFVRHELVDTVYENYYTRGILRLDASRLAHDLEFVRMCSDVKRRTSKVATD